MEDLIYKILISNIIVNGLGISALAMYEKNRPLGLLVTACITIECIITMLLVYKHTDNKTKETTRNPNSNTTEQ